jgi:L-fuconolactonase
MARCGVQATVLVQAAATAAETGFLLQLARRHPFVAGVVGWVDFEGADAPDAIARLAANQRLVGLRPMIQDLPDPRWMLKPSLATAIGAMIEHDLVFDALVRPQHLDALLEFATRYPALRIVVDHGAKPPLRAGDLAPWKADIAAIAHSTRAVCKISGLVTEAGSADPEALAACTDHLLRTFGAHRLMWGSDWPVCELVCSYERWVDSTSRLLATLGEADRERIYSGTARETYGI